MLEMWNEQIVGNGPNQSRQTNRRPPSTLDAVGDMNAGMPERSPVQAAVAALLRWAAAPASLWN
jgi:hypothetical protein